MIRWRELIMPREHGVWGLLAGAALVGLPLGRDLGGLPLLGAALAGVMLRQAYTVQAGTPGRRRVVGLAGAAALGCLALCGVLAGTPAWVPWTVAAIAIGAICLHPPAGRPWWSSALAGVSAGLLAGGVAAAGGAGQAWAAVAAGALAMHLTSTVPLVRAQTRGSSEWAALAIELHVIAVVLAVGGWAGGLWDSGIPLVFLFGLARAAWLVDKRTTMSVSPARVGLRELAWLPILAAGVFLGLRGGWC